MQKNVSYKKSNRYVLFFGLFGIMLATVFSMSCEPTAPSNHALKFEKSNNQVTNVIEE